MIKYFNDIKHLFFAWRLKRLKKKMDKLAIEAHKKNTKERFYLLKFQGNMQIINTTEFKRMKHIGLFPNTVTQDTLKKIAYYYTT